MFLKKLMIGFFSMVFLLTACSGTKTEFSWSNENFKGKIENIYIIGIAKNDFNRMYFENTFYQKLKNEGVKSIPSSTSLPKDQATSKDVIVQKMTENNCDSVLLTRVTNQRTVATFTSGRSSYRYVPGPTYSGVRLYERPAYYNAWDNYYYAAYQVVVKPPTTTNIVKLTVESVLYDLKTEELIWSALMETDLEANVEDMIRKFVDEAVKDLKQVGLISQQ